MSPTEPIDLRDRVAGAALAWYIAHIAFHGELHNRELGEQLGEAERALREACARYRLAHRKAASAGEQPLESDLRDLLMGPPDLRPGNPYGAGRGHE